MRRAIITATLLLLTPPAYAVSTTPTLLTTTWQDLGAGPIQVQSTGPAYLALSDTPPTAGTGGFKFDAGLLPYSFCGTTHVYARVMSSVQRSVVQAAPATCAGSGGGSGGSVTQGTMPWVTNMTQWASTALGAPTNYGTAPTGVVPGTNAFVTNFPATQAVSWTGQTVAATQSGAWNTNLYVGGAANASGNPAFVSVTNFPTSQPAYEQGSSLAAAGIAPVVTAAGTSAVGKASQGNLYSGYAVNATTTAGYLVAINAAAVPTAGAAITPVDVAYLAGTVGATASINYGAGPPNAYSTGIVLLVTTSLTTYTAGGNAFIQARVR